MRKPSKHILFLALGLGFIMSGYCRPHKEAESHRKNLLEVVEQKDQYINFKGRLAHLAQVMKRTDVRDEEQVSSCMDLIAQLVNERVDATGRDLDSFKVFLGKAQKTFKNVIHVHEQLQDALNRIQEPIPFSDRYDLLQDMIDDGIVTREEQSLFISRLRALTFDLSSAKPEERNDLVFLVDDFFETIENADTQKAFIKAITECRTHLRAEMQKYEMPFLVDDFIKIIKDMMQESFDSYDKRDLFMHRLSRLVYYPDYSAEELIKVKTFFNDNIMALIDGRADWKILKGKLVCLSEDLSKRQILNSFASSSELKIPKGALFNLVSLNPALSGVFFVTAVRGNKLKASISNPLELETQFDLVEHADGTVSLRNKLKNNVIQCGKGELVLAPEKDHLAQRFFVEGNSFDMVLQSCSTKKYLSVAGDGSLISVSVKGTGEHFKIVLLTPYQVSLSQNRLRDDMGRLAGYKLQLSSQAKTIFEREMLVKDIKSLVDEKKVNKKSWELFKANADVIREVLLLIDFLSLKSEYHPFVPLFSLIKKTLNSEKKIHEDVPKTFKDRILILNTQMKKLLSGKLHYTKKSCFIDEAQLLIKDRSDGSIDDLALLKAILVHARAKLFMQETEGFFRMRTEELLAELHTVTPFEERIARFKNTVEMCSSNESMYPLLAIKIKALMRDFKSFSKNEIHELEIYLNEIQANMHNEKDSSSFIKDIKKLEGYLKNERHADA